MSTMSKLATAVQHNVRELSNACITGFSAAYKWISARLPRGGATRKQRLRAVLAGRRRESSQR
jgi:hypothetical protein